MELRQKFQKSFRRNSTAGFSLVELLVAVSILIILSATFLINYGTFDHRLMVNVLAHQIAGWVHDAQVSAMSIKRARNEQGQFPGYGLYFDMASKNKFIFFADLDRDREYDPLVGSQKCGDPSVECEQEITMLKGNTIATICGDRPSSLGQATDCSSVNPGSPALYSNSVAHILFARPNPFDATILGDPNTALIPPMPTAHSNVEITIISPKGYHHTITIWITGQASVR